MKIPAFEIEKYLGEDEIRVCHPDGRLWMELSPAGVRALADQGAITGVGSLARLKYVVLEASQEDGVAILERAYGGRVLQRSQASQTVRREKVTVTAPRQRMRNGSYTQSGTFTVFGHRSGAFSPEARQEYR